MEGMGRAARCEVTRRVLGALLVTGLVGCSHSTLDTSSVEVSMTASPTTAAPGDTITFVVSAQGGNLIGVTIDYADSSSDQYGTSGARSARVTFKHAYLTRGTFTVQATASDAVAGQKDASVVIHVN